MNAAPSPEDSATAEPGSIYDAIGGEAAIAACVDVFYGKMLADPELSPFFPGGVGIRHRRHIATFIGEALGGPANYRGPDLARAHSARGISDDHFNKTAGHLAESLTELGVPDDLVVQIITIVATLRPVVVTPDLSSALPG
jgi:hemoglobin